MIAPDTPRFSKKVRKGQRKPELVGGFILWQETATKGEKVYRNENRI